VRDKKRAVAVELGYIIVFMSVRERKRTNHASGVTGFKRPVKWLLKGVLVFERICYNHLCQTVTI